MPDALPHGSFAFLFRQVLLFSVSLSYHLLVPYPSLLLQPQRLPQHCIVEDHGSQLGQQACKLVPMLVRLLEIRTPNKAFLKPPGPRH